MALSQHQFEGRLRHCAASVAETCGPSGVWNGRTKAMVQSFEKLARDMGWEWFEPLQLAAQADRIAEYYEAEWESRNSRAQAVGIKPLDVRFNRDEYRWEVYGGGGVWIDYDRTVSERESEVVA